MGVTFQPKDKTYDVRNHNGALMGFIKHNSNYWWFYPRTDWESYSSYQLEEIVKFLNRLNKE